ncbi:hypothetical protein, partial [Microbulbifer harenosus]|uniref:hypothetical protein n=1 Tax=Microbulbifer harenosus TaxID=2576840 RepID=UPI001C6FE004
KAAQYWMLFSGTEVSEATKRSKILTGTITPQSDAAYFVCFLHENGSAATAQKVHKAGRRLHCLVMFIHWILE